MLDLDTNLDFGNIHLDRRFWLSGRLAVQTKARLCYSNANARPSRARCKAAGGTGSRAGCIAVAWLVDFAAGSLCVLRRVGFGRKTAIANDRFCGLWRRLLCRSRFWLVLVRSEIGLCGQIVRGGRRVSLSTFTSSTLSQRFASRVAEVPAMAISRISPALICRMELPS